MSLESVRAFFAEKAPDIISHGIPDQFGDRAAGCRSLWRRARHDRQDAVLARRRARDPDRRGRHLADGQQEGEGAFGGKPKMLGLEEVAEITGHEVGGVCPFGLKSPLPVYCDVSLKAFDVVVPAAGSTHSAVRITPERMAELTAAEWVDVCEIRP